MATPVGLAAFPALPRIVPRVDPLGGNVERFGPYYDGFVVAANRFGIDPSKALLPAVGVVLYAAGTLAENAKRNWFVGIRTPWTMSSDEVWERTHRLGRVLLKLSGVVAVFGVFAGDDAVYFVAVPAAATAAVTAVYSYVAYRGVGLGGA